MEAKKNRQNQDSKQIPKLKKEGKDVSELLEQMKELSEEIKQMDAQVGLIEEELEKALLNIPNTPSDQVPWGPAMRIMKRFADGASPDPWTLS